MDINRMRLGLMYIFSESKGISKKGKMQLVSFIENATNHQLKSLALDGEIVASATLDEQACEILDDRFQAAEHIEKSLRKASTLALQKISKK